MGIQYLHITIVCSGSKIFKVVVLSGEVHVVSRRLLPEKVLCRDSLYFLVPASLLGIVYQARIIPLHLMEIAKHAPS
jgi:hypothetical protein